MITQTTIQTRELDRTPDLADVVGAARDAGHEVMLIERPMPDAVSVAAIGRVFDMVATRGGVALEDAEGKTVDFEAGENRILAASHLWRRLRISADAVAVGAGVRDYNDAHVAALPWMPQSEHKTNANSGPGTNYPMEAGAIGSK